MIDYKNIIIDFGGSIIYSNYTEHDLIIDGERWWYDTINDSGRPKTYFTRSGGSKNYCLPMILKLNVDDPGETLNRFFKLLLLV